MDIENGDKQQKQGDREDSPIPYLPGLGQGEQLAEDEELVADMSCEHDAILLSPVFSDYSHLHSLRLLTPCSLDMAVSIV